jgi:hypothetical protein
MTAARRTYYGLTLVVLLLAAAWSQAAGAAGAARTTAGEEPGSFKPVVKELTVFKDGHALLLREGTGTPVGGELVTYSTKSCASSANLARPQNGSGSMAIRQKPLR